MSESVLAKEQPDRAYNGRKERVSVLAKEQLIISAGEYSLMTPTTAAVYKMQQKRRPVS